MAETAEKPGGDATDAPPGGSPVRSAPSGAGAGLQEAVVDALTLGLVAASLAYLVTLLLLDIPRVPLVLENSLDPGVRHLAFRIVAFAAIGGVLAAAGL